jgi:hypothetical protein
MMEQKLRLYLWWKSKLAERKKDGREAFHLPNKDGQNGNDAGDHISEALKKKDQETKNRQASRRRVRGGGVAVAPAPRKKDDHGALAMGQGEMQVEADEMATLYVALFSPLRLQLMSRLALLLRDLPQPPDPYSIWRRKTAPTYRYLT